MSCEQWWGPQPLCRNVFETVCASVPVGCLEVTRLKSELSQAQDTVAKLQASAGGHGPVMGMLL